MLMSKREYARSRKARGLPGGTLAAVQKALASSRIEETADGKISSAEADRTWRQRTSAMKSRAVEEAVLPPATSAEFDRGARWLAGELCVSARRVWPKFVGNLDMAIFPEEQRSAVRGLFVAIQTHLLERWVADFVDDAKLPPIDWAACFGAADAEHIRIECEQLQTSWKRTD